MMHYLVTNTKTKLSKKIPIFVYEQSDRNKILNFYAGHPDYTISTKIETKDLYNG